jgi:hypothetical protein
VVDKLGGAGIGQQGSEIREDAQGSFEGTDGQESGVGDELSALKIDVELLRTKVPQGKVLLIWRSHDLEPPQMSK